MRNKKVISVIATILAVLMLITIVVSVIPTSAFAVDQSDVDKKQQEKEQLASTAAGYAQKLNELKEQQATVLEQKRLYDESVDYTLKQISLTEEQIAIYDEMIREKYAEVTAAKELEEQQLQRFRTRVRAMEENGSYNILSIIFNSGSLSDMLSAIEDYHDIMNYDKQLEAEYVAAREAYEDVLEEYQKDKAGFEEKKLELEAEKADLKAKIDEANQLLDDLAKDIEKAEQEYLAAEAAKQAASYAVDNLIAQIMAQNAANQAASGGTVTPSAPAGAETAGGSGSDTGNTGNVGAAAQGIVGTGNFIWPVPSSYRVSSTYKMRTDPVTGSYVSKHTGVDIDGFALEGYPVIASDAGVVIIATYDSGYGNYVVIDHGNNYFTLYGHMSGLAVSVNQAVTQGQTLGYLGSTGWSTGTHCHFEIRIGGNGTSYTVDPLSYFGGYVLEPGA